MLQTTVITKALENEGFKVEAVQVVKNGTTLQGIRYIPEGANISPTAYIDECRTEAEAIEYCKKLFSQPLPEIDTDNLFDKSKLRARIYGAGKATSDIKRSFLDLEIVASVLVDMGNGSGSFVLNSNNLSISGMTEEEVLNVALENSFAECQTMNIVEMMKKMSGVPLFEDELPMDVLTNQGETPFGAIQMMNIEALEASADFYNSDLWILPSSLHEVIVVPSNLGDAEIFKGMVECVNAEEVKAEDKLSDNVYRFNRSTKTITIA